MGNTEGPAASGAPERELSEGGENASPRPTRGQSPDGNGSIRFDAQDESGAPGDKSGNQRDFETLKVRVRAKNPLIERRPSHSGEGETLASKPELDTFLEEEKPESGADVQGSLPDESTSNDDHPSPRENDERASAPVMKKALSEDDDTVVVEPHGQTTAETNPAAPSPAAENQPRWDALERLRSELTDEERNALYSTLNGSFERPGMDGSTSPKRTLEHLILDDPFQALSVAEKAMLLRAVSRQPRDVATMKAGIAILKTRIFRQLKGHDRAALLDLFLSINSESRALLAGLAARTLRSASALLDRDRDQANVIEHLHALATSTEQSSAFEQVHVRQDIFMTTLLTTLAQPERLVFDEGTQGVLSAIEFDLAQNQPAEFARLARELMAKNFRVRIIDGVIMDIGLLMRQRGSDAIPPRNTIVRWGIEALSCMRGGVKAGSAGLVMPGGAGIDADVTAQTLSLLHGAPYGVVSGTKNILDVLERTSEDAARRPPVFVSLLSEKGERLFVFDHLDKTALFLRAPHGRSMKREGTFRMHPKRRVMDPKTGLESITLDELDELAGVALFPRSRPTQAHL